MPTIAKMLEDCRFDFANGEILIQSDAVTSWPDHKPTGPLVKMNDLNALAIHLTFNRQAPNVCAHFVARDSLFTYRHVVIDGRDDIQLEFDLDFDAP